MPRKNQLNLSAVASTQKFHVFTPDKKLKMFKSAQLYEKNKSTHNPRTELEPTRASLARRKLKFDDVPTTPKNNNDLNELSSQVTALAQEVKIFSTNVNNDLRTTIKFTENEPDFFNSTNPSAFLETTYLIFNSGLQTLMELSKKLIAQQANTEQMLKHSDVNAADQLVLKQISDKLENLINKLDDCHTKLKTSDLLETVKIAANASSTSVSTLLKNRSDIAKWIDTLYMEDTTAQPTPTVSM